MRRRPLPDATGSYYTPPGFFAVGGVAIELGERLGLDHPERVGQIFNALAAIGTLLLLLVLVRLLWPGRDVLHLAAVVFFVACPVVMKSAAMFHPEPLSMLLSTAALVLAARLLVSLRLPPPRRCSARRRARPRAARPCLDAAGRSVSSSSSLAVAAVTRSRERRRLARRRRGRRRRSRSSSRRRGTPTSSANTTAPSSGSRSPTSRSGRAGRSGSSSARGLPELVTSPYRPSFSRRFVADRLHRGVGRLLRRLAVARRARRRRRPRRAARARDHVDRRPAVHAGRARRMVRASRPRHSVIPVGPPSASSSPCSRSPPSPASSTSRRRTRPPTGTP